MWTNALPAFTEGPRKCWVSGVAVAASHFGVPAFGERDRRNLNQDEVVIGRVNVNADEQDGDGGRRPTESPIEARGLRAAKKPNSFSENLVMEVDILFRRCWRHQSHVVERGSQDPAVRQVQT